MTLNTPSGLPEAERALESIWSRLIDAHTGTITAETRALLEEVLSHEQLNKLLEKGRHSGSKKTPTMKRSGMDAILKELTSSGVGMLPVIEKRMKEKLKHQGVKTVDQFGLVVESGKPSQLMENLVRDPDSPAAMALACLYEDIVSSKGAWAYYVNVFDSVDESEARNAETLKMAQELYKEITTNKSYLGIGEDPAGGGAGSGKLRQLRDEITKYDAAILASGKSRTTKFGVTKDDPTPYINLKKEAETKVDSLVSSKSDLEGKLTQLNSRLQALSAENIAHAPVKIVPIADIEALAKNFSVASFNAELKKTPPHVDNSYIELAGNTKTVLEWLLDKELSQKANDAIAQFRQAGPGFIPAQMAYERLMKKAIGTGVGLTPEQGEQIVQQVSSRGLSSQAPAEAAAKKPGFLMSTIFGGAKHAGHAAGKAAEKGKGGLSKIWGYLWEDV